MLTIILNTPLVDIFGEGFCQTLVFSTFFGNGYSTFGSLGIATFRVVYIKANGLFLGCKEKEWVLAVTVLLATLFINTSTVALFYVIPSPRSYLKVCMHLSVIHTNEAVSGGTFFELKAT